MEYYSYLRTKLVAALAVAVVIFEIPASLTAYSCEARMCQDYGYPVDVFLSSPAYTFGVEFRSLILQPSGSNLDYAAEAFPRPVPSPHWKIHKINPDFHYGFDLVLDTVFCQENANLTMKWEHFRSRDSASRVVPPNNMIGPFFEIGPDALPYTVAEGKVNYHFDQVDLDYGVFVNFGCRLQTNLFAGVSFANIRQTLHSTFSNADETIVREIDVPSSFIGAGPQMGINFDYGACNGFSVTGSSTASLLVGRVKNHTNYEALSPALEGLGITPPNEQSTSVDRGTQVVPAFGGRLGIAYSCALCDRFIVGIEAGYQAQIFIHAIQSIDIGSEVNTPPVLPDTIGVFARTFKKNLSNFALAGPYISLKVEF